MRHLWRSRLCSHPTSLPLHSKGHSASQGQAESTGGWTGPLPGAGAAAKEVSALHARGAGSAAMCCHLSQSITKHVFPKGTSGLLGLRSAAVNNVFSLSALARPQGHTSFLNSSREHRRTISPCTQGRVAPSGRQQRSARRPAKRRGCRLPHLVIFRGFLNCQQEAVIQGFCNYPFLALFCFSGNR